MPIVTVHKLASTDEQLMEHIADWYLNEWAIPRDRTISRLANHPNDDVLFQLILKEDGVPVATGGLYNNVGLLQKHQIYQKLKPWVALLYTDMGYRSKGFGTKLLDEIQNMAREIIIPKLYLYTFTAEAFYVRNGWAEMDRVKYNGHDTVIMRKEV